MSVSVRIYEILSTHPPTVLNQKKKLISYRYSSCCGFVLLILVGVTSSKKPVPPLLIMSGCNLKGLFLSTPSKHRLMESDIRYNFQDGRYDVISRRKVLPSRECGSNYTTIVDFVACFIPKISGTIFRPVHGRLAEWRIWNVSVCTLRLSCCCTFCGSADRNKLCGDKKPRPLLQVCKYLARKASKLVVVCIELNQYALHWQGPKVAIFCKEFSSKDGLA